MKSLSALQQLIYDSFLLCEEFNYSKALKDLLTKGITTFYPKGASFFDIVEIYLYKNKKGWSIRLNTGEEFGPYKSQKEAAQKGCSLFQND